MVFKENTFITWIDLDAGCITDIRVSFVSCAYQMLNLNLQALMLIHKIPLILLLSRRKKNKNNCRKDEKRNINNNRKIHKRVILFHIPDVTLCCKR